MNGLIANGTLSPRLIRQCQVMQNTWPTIDMTASRHLAGHRMIQTNRTLRLLDGLHMNLFDKLPCDQSVRTNSVRLPIDIGTYDKLASSLKKLFLIVLDLASAAATSSMTAAHTTNGSTFGLPSWRIIKIKQMVQILLFTSW